MELGRVPRRIPKPSTPEQHHEHALADRLRKIRKSLPDQDVHRLTTLEKTSRTLREDQIQEWKRSGEFCPGGKMYGTMEWSTLYQPASYRIVLQRFCLKLDFVVISLMFLVVCLYRIVAYRIVPNRVYRIVRIVPCVSYRGAVQQATSHRIVSYRTNMRNQE